MFIFNCTSWSFQWWREVSSCFSCASCHYSPRLPRLIREQWQERLLRSCVHPSMVIRELSEKNSESPLKQICPGWHSIGCYSRMTTVGRKWWHPMRPGSRLNRRGERDYAQTTCGCVGLTRLKWQIFRTLQTTFNSLEGKKRLLLLWSQNMLFRLKFKNTLPLIR